MTKEITKEVYSSEKEKEDGYRSMSIILPECEIRIQSNQETDSLKQMQKIVQENLEIAMKYKNGSEYHG